MEDTSSDRKTRDQSLFQFLESLQLEYIQAELRRKIYVRAKDKIFQEKVMCRKKDKILDISSRNSLSNIFNDTDVYDSFYRRIYNVDNYPNFIYANENQRKEFEIRDFINYYSTNSEVKVLGYETPLIGTIVKSPEEGIVQVQINGEDDPRLVKGELVIRIL